MMKLDIFKHQFLLLISLAAMISIFFIDAIPQDLNYHLFNDQSLILNIPNFWNVVSNLPFLVVGILGVKWVKNSKAISLTQQRAYYTFFIGVALVAFGSSYYHLAPTNNSLLWDRLPMTIAFMALFSIVIGEFISEKLNELMFFPLVFLGGFSVLYWRYTEGQGQGDLRMYIVIQFLPMILIPLILLLYKSKGQQVKGYPFLLLAYFIAKLLEFYDGQIHDVLMVISGHSLKHIMAAFGVWLLLKSYTHLNKKGV